MRKRTIAAIGVALTAVAASVPAQAVPAKAPVVSPPIAEGLAGPLQIDVNRHGIAVAQSFSKTVSKVRANGTTKDLVTESGNPNRGADVAGVLLRKGGVVYTHTIGARGLAKLKFVSNNGNTRTIADLAEYEGTANPDQGVTYGVRSISPSCESEWPVEDFGPPAYQGIVESHPYAIAKAPGGWYVADAAANAILKVRPSGNVRSVAVLKPQPTVITQEAADENGFPDCVVGKKYFFEPVPTDVEVTDNGKLIVSLLPGGPEDPSLGARGKVVRVNPDTGTSSELASGFLGATNVAINNAGAIFVTSLFGGTISKVGGPADFVELPLPAAMDYYRGKLYVGHDVFPPFPPNGKIVTIN